MSAVEFSTGYREPLRYETLAGKPVAMSPSPRINHGRAVGNIFKIFERHLKGRKCEAFFDGVDVHLTDQDTVIPDVLVVCNPDIVKQDAIYGPPDLIVEILSPGTARYDRGYKKDLYERCGVREYWLVDTANIQGGSIEIYELIEGRYHLQAMHHAYFAYEIEQMKPAEKEKLVHSFSPCIFPEMEFALADVFENII